MLNQGVSFTVSQILCDIIPLSPAYSREEPKICILTLSRILKRLAAFSLSFTLPTVLCSATNLSVCPQRFLVLSLVASCQATSIDLSKPLKFHLLCPAEISGPLSVCYIIYIFLMREMGIALPCQ
ncbi:hypothetical protein XENOCAPTIV_020299 [Xenoophorus captivus]|uniref:Uncharacterized protein n=1 Tax=Xenoophorus captivus TaxID=1517983 RepID=A0ABV0RZM5_9TELE